LRGSWFPRKSTAANSHITVFHVLFDTPENVKKTNGRNASMLLGTSERKTHSRHGLLKDQPDGSKPINGWPHDQPKKSKRQR
jgi:hypothetical protein